MGVYKREGNTPERAWNELIRRVNALADECGFDPVEEVEQNHVWSKADIREVQDKLREICEDNEFDPIPATWKQSIIDQFIEAIERGCCECSREPVLLDVAEFPYTSETNGISGGTDGLVFLREWNLFDVSFDAQIDAFTELNALREQLFPTAKQQQLAELETQREELAEELANADPEEEDALRAELDALDEEIATLEEEIKNANKAKGRHFWAITKQFDTGVGQFTWFGVIEKDGTLRDPESLGAAQPNTPDMIVNGGAVYHFVALCQDFDTLTVLGAATFFNGDPPENFGAILPDWRELTDAET